MKQIHDFATWFAGLNATQISQLVIPIVAFGLVYTLVRIKFGPKKVNKRRFSKSDPSIWNPEYDQKVKENLPSYLNNRGRILK